MMKFHFLFSFYGEFGCSEQEELTTQCKVFNKKAWDSNLVLHQKLIDVLT